MRWARISIRTNPEALEAVAAALESRNTGGTLFEPGPSAIGFVPADDRLEQTLDSLRAALDAMPSVGIDPRPARITLTFEEDMDWATAWRDHFQPVHVSSRLTICPCWHDYTAGEGEEVVWLDPGMAFGTGGHESTRLCMRALEETVRQGDEVADIGTGSGVLAVTAAKLGAAQVSAIDNDPLAVDAAKVNAEKNGVSERVGVSLADGLEGLIGPFDIVVANILPLTVAALAPAAFGRLKPGGLYVVSGFTHPYERDVLSCLKGAGFVAESRWEEAQWVALTARRPAEGSLA